MFVENLFSADESSQYFETLMNQIQWRQEPIILFGKSILQPRLTALYGDPEKQLRYSGIVMNPLPWTESLLQIKKRIEPLAEKIFTTALINLYRDGKDSMGWHRDDEKELGINPVIGSVSFGATRKFQFRHFKKQSLKQTVLLTSGSFLLMSGSCQHNWQHSIAKTKIPTGPRINITFRVL